MHAMLVICIEAIVITSTRATPTNHQASQLVDSQNPSRVIKPRQGSCKMLCQALTLSHSHYHLAVAPNHFVPQSFCLSVPSSVAAANALLKTKSHKPSQSRHKVILTLTKLHKPPKRIAKQTLFSNIPRCAPLSICENRHLRSNFPPRFLCDLCA